MARTFDPLREMDRLFSEVTRAGSNSMPMDLYRTGETFVAEVDLPGVDSDSIDIDIDERTLTIRAARRTSAEAGRDVKFVTRERPSGTFARQIALGQGLAYDKISAEYADGVLKLTIPVAEEAKPRKVAVQHKQPTQSIAGETLDASEDSGA
jgi:HSP20 family protein